MGHREWGSLHYKGWYGRFFSLLGGTVPRISDGYSWSGWIYGATFAWGYAWIRGLGDHDNVLQDVLRNSRMVVYWSTDPALAEELYRTHDPSWFRIWMKEVGTIKSVFINPIFTDTNAVWGDQWIPIYPGADTALALAIANVWIKEGTYDKDYVRTHTFGFEKWSDYVTGKTPGTDGAIDRTPQWAEKITGVPAQTTIDLAREWASKPTTLICTNAGACRTVHAEEWARSMVGLLAMQGVGKPGVNIWSCGCGGTVSIGAPHDFRQVPPPGYGAGGGDTVSQIKMPPSKVRGALHYLNEPIGIMTDFTKNPPIKWKGGAGVGSASATNPYGVNNIWREYQYPYPGESEIHMMFRYGGSSCSVDAIGAEYAKMYLSPKIEFAVSCCNIMEPETLYMDLILPGTSSLERNDISEVGNTGRAANGMTQRMVVFQHQIVPPQGECKLEMEIFQELSNRLGFGDKFSDGNTEEGWLRKMFNLSSIATGDIARNNQSLTYEQFKEKGYYVYELPKDFDVNNAENSGPIGLRWYYDKPQGDGLQTPSGKIEFYSQTLVDKYGENSTAIGEVPKYFVDPDGKQSPLAAKYPLSVVTPHPKFRVHQQMDNLSWLRDLYKYKGYEPCWIAPADAQSRGIVEKDIIRIWNDYHLAGILCYAHITHRVMPGVIKVEEGSWFKPLEPGNPDSTDTGGAIDVLASNIPMSDHAYTCRYNSMLVQVEKWKGA